MKTADWQSGDGSIRLYQGDCAAVLADLPEKSVNCCVTSPPYWGLRDYGTAEWEGGDAGCDHIKGEMRRGVNLAQSQASTRGGAKKCAEVANIPFGDTCGKCGARRIDSQLGLEATPEEYVDKLVEIFRQVRRVLRDDGTVWLNLGDVYAHASSGGGGAVDIRTDGRKTTPGDKVRGRMAGANTLISGLKPKDLCGIPWRVAFALQADGWYLRQDIIWAKPNPMPESVTDRCTKAHEYIFLLSKKARYWFDAEAIKEKADNRTGGAPRVFGAIEQEGTNRKDIGLTFMDNGIRNKRSVWTVATRPYPEVHFATYPAKLIEPCILAGCPAGGVVLDPFIGSGTTAEVCATKGRGCIGIELNREYMELAIRRIRPAIQQGPDDALFRQKAEQPEQLLMKVDDG